MTTQTLAATTDRLAATCPLTEWGADQDPTRCRWCNRPAGGDPWCSYPCRTAFWENHSWNLAKNTRKTRAKRRCEQCGERGGATAAVHHLEHGERGDGTPQTRLASCAHHQDGLRYLCFHCHQAEHHPQPAAGEPPR